MLCKLPRKSCFAACYHVELIIGQFEGLVYPDSKLDGAFFGPLLDE